VDKYKKKEDMVGVYSRGPLKSFLWMAMTQTAPTLSGSSVTNPEPTPIITNELSFVYQYIPLVLEKGYTYFPSIFAAEGLCIKTKLTSSFKVKGAITDIKKFYERFSHAIYFRNWFPFTRVTFIAHDKQRSFFPYKWKYPKLTEDKRENLFEGAKKVMVEAKDDILYSSVKELESEALFDDDGAEAEQALLLLLTRLTQDEIKKLLASRGSFHPTGPLEPIYFALSRERFFKLVKDAVREEDINLPMEDLGYDEDFGNAVIPTTDIEPTQDFEDFFTTGAIRIEVTAKPATTPVSPTIDKK